MVTSLHKMRIKLTKVVTSVQLWSKKFHCKVGICIILIVQYFYFSSLRQKAVQHSWLTMHSWLYWISAWWIIPWKCKVCHSMLSYLQNQFLVLHRRYLMAYFSAVLHKNAPGHDIFQKFWCTFSMSTLW